MASIQESMLPPRGQALPLEPENGQLVLPQIARPALPHIQMNILPENHNPEEGRELNLIQVRFANVQKFAEVLLFSVVGVIIYFIVTSYFPK